MERVCPADKASGKASTATQALQAPNSQPALPEIAGALRYVARLPIMDLCGRVHGYELLFRAGSEAAFRGDGDAATCTMLDNTVIFGLEKLTGGLPAAEEVVRCYAESVVCAEAALESVE
jgi:hypothetical protein